MQTYGKTRNDLKSLRVLFFTFCQQFVEKLWVAFLLCLFLGIFGAHKFYEGKIGMGVLYLLTGGLLLFGWIIDCVALLLKPNPYYV